MFGKFMNKKFFHPSSYPNQKQKWIHQQRADAKEKLENEKKETYQKEQESYQSRLLSAKTKEDKMKLDLNFLYDLPPGMKRDNEEEEREEKEVKFEWQKNAPRSKYIKDLGIECQDQPFGILVKNIRCFKCKQWGHQNTDRECPLFFANIPSSGSSGKSQAESLRLSDPLRLIADMRIQHGIVLKRSVIGQEIDPMAENNQLLDSEEDEPSEKLADTDMKYIASLSNKEKKKLLKTLNQFEKSTKNKNKNKHRDSSGVDGEDDSYSKSKRIQKKKTTERYYSSDEERNSRDNKQTRRDKKSIQKNRHKRIQSETKDSSSDYEEFSDMYNRSNPKDKTKRKKDISTSPTSPKRRRKSEVFKVRKESYHEDKHGVDEMISQCRKTSKKEHSKRRYER